MKPMPRTAGLAKSHTAEHMDLHHIPQKHSPHTHREGPDRRMVRAQRTLKALPQGAAVPRQNAWGQTASEIRAMEKKLHRPPICWWTEGAT